MNRQPIHNALLAPDAMEIAGRAHYHALPEATKISMGGYYPQETIRIQAETDCLLIDGKRTCIGVRQQQTRTKIWNNQTSVEFFLPTQRYLLSNESGLTELVNDLRRAGAL
ncbi:MAG: hypothetical protein PHP85_14620 [Gallionella sp.]|nr:hypothetical protein [Gallionella sp.]